ncbi:hypothetical protein [Membranihabitans maritimus]|uniref:hypothetical protein n=1 Tax=Membranihabitans maritimus TaxID=2904244 RepID=UPI001F171E0A|nr:hypothetical protein [Membranihabitans maritimus]
MSKKHIFYMEVLWLVVSLLVPVVLIFPYYGEMIDSVPFLLPNFIIGFLLVQTLRHIFFLPQSLLGNSGWGMVPFVFSSIPICIYIIRQMSLVNLFFETTTWIHSFSYVLNLNEKRDLSQYVKTEFTIISVATFILAIVLSLRLIVALWRKVNNKGRI